VKSRHTFHKTLENLRYFETELDLVTSFLNFRIHTYRAEII